MSITTNAYTQLEWGFAHKIHDMLSSLNFPFERLELSIVFKETMKDHSANMIKVDEPVEDSDPLTGLVSFVCNSLFLSQDPSTFFEHVVIHEIAHIFSGLAAIKKGEKIKLHGPEWQDYMYKMSENPILDSKIESELFDNRAAISRSGGCVASCNCLEVDYIAFGTRSAEYRDCANGELDCGVCGGIKGPLLESIKFLHLISGHRSEKDFSESPLAQSLED